MALRVAVIGISYKDNPVWPELPYARQDALKILNVLRSYSEGTTDFFTALEAEHTSLFMLEQGLKRFFSRTAIGDHVVLIFEGHGSESAGNTYLVPSDHPGGGPDRALALGQVTAWLEQGKPANRILIIDACHAGQGRARLGPDVLVPGPGMSVLAACDLAEEALDMQELGGGLFSFMVYQALGGAAAVAQGSHRRVTVAGLFQYVAREVPTWLESNRSRLGIPHAIRMTPRLITDLRGDPLLTSVPVIQRQSTERRSLSDLPATSALPRDLRACLEPLQDLARVAAARALGHWGRDQLFLDADLHRHELELLIGRCLADLCDQISLVELFVLQAAICVHDLGLLESQDVEKRFRRSAQFVRRGRAHDLPIVFPDTILAEAVAQTVERLGGSGGGESMLWGGRAVRVGLLGEMLGLAHRLAVMGERVAADVGEHDIGRLWVRRPLLSGLSDWHADGAALIQVAPGLDRLEWVAVERWQAQAASALTRRQTMCDVFGPVWLDVRRQ